MRTPGDKELRKLPLDDRFFGALLVGRIAVGVQEQDGDRCTPSLTASRATL